MAFATVSQQVKTSVPFVVEEFKFTSTADADTGSSGVLQGVGSAAVPIAPDEVTLTCTQTGTTALSSAVVHAVYNISTHKIDFLTRSNAAPGGTPAFTCLIKWYKSAAPNLT